MSIICEMLHTAFKKCGFGMHPWMIEIGYPVKGEDCGATILSLIEPGEIARFVREKVQALSNIKSGIEPAFAQDGCGEGML